MRNIYKGHDELSSLVNGAGLSEDKTSNYSLEEKKVFKISQDTNRLIEVLESKK